MYREVGGGMMCVWCCRLLHDVDGEICVMNYEIHDVCFPEWI